MRKKRQLKLLKGIRNLYKNLVQCYGISACINSITASEKKFQTAESKLAL